MGKAKAARGVMNYKRHNPHGAFRRKNRYTNWGGRKAFKKDFLDKQLFKKTKHSVL